MVELGLAHFVIDYYMTLAKMEDNIQLRRVGEPEFNSLPKGVKLIVIGEKLIFVKRMGIHFMPLPELEQEDLRRKHIIS